MDEPPLHGDLAPLAFLVGEWIGGGHGHYPTIEPFEWRERTRFWHVGKPVMLYEQRTQDAVTGEPRHLESGFLRPGPEPDQFELIVAHNTGHAESSTGTVTGSRLDVGTMSLVGSATAKEVVEVHRSYERDGEVLRTNLSMAAVGQPMTHHLEGALTRETP